MPQVVKRDTPRDICGVCLCLTLHMCVRTIFDLYFKVWNHHFCCIHGFVDTTESCGRVEYVSCLLLFVWYSEAKKVSYAWFI